MSFELNGEHRSGINIISSSNALRCCSFCHRAGHNITSCNSMPIMLFERNCSNFIRFNIYDGVADFRNFVLEEVINNSNVVRAFALSRCGARIRNNIDTCIELIVQYFTPLIEHRNQNQNRATEDDLTERLRYARLLINMIGGISEPDRTFKIKTSLSENHQENLEEKCDCNICYEEHEKKNFAKFDCGHEFCKDCTKKYLQNEKRSVPCCAFCRSEIKNIELKTETAKEEFEEFITPEFVDYDVD